MGLTKIFGVFLAAKEKMTNYFAWDQKNALSSLYYKACAYPTSSADDILLLVLDP